MIHTLTVDDVLALRASVRWKVNVTLPDSIPRIIYSASDDAYVLHIDGHVWAQHRDITMLAALLRGERAEPGFIRRITDTTEPPDLASLAPDLRVAELARLRSERRKIEAHETEQAALAARRLEVMDVTRLDLDDLL